MDGRTDGRGRAGGQARARDQAAEGQRTFIRGAEKQKRRSLERQKHQNVVVHFGLSEKKCFRTGGMTFLQCRSPSYLE